MIKVYAEKKILFLNDKKYILLECWTDIWFFYLLLCWKDTILSFSLYFVYLSFYYTAVLNDKMKLVPLGIQYEKKVVIMSKTIR